MAEELEVRLSRLEAEYRRSKVLIRLLIVVLAGCVLWMIYAAVVPGRVRAEGVSIVDPSGRTRIEMTYRTPSIPSGPGIEFYDSEGTRRGRIGLSKEHVSESFPALEFFDHQNRRTMFVGMKDNVAPELYLQSSTGIIWKVP